MRWQWFLVSSLLLSQPVLANVFTDNQAVQQFIQRMAKEHQINAQELTQNFKAIDKNEKVIQLIKKPAEKMEWGDYQKWLVTDERVKKGVDYWNQHAQTLANIEKEFGIPAEIIVAIIGVESYYGKARGRYPVFESLATLAFHYPPRARFFEKELEEFLLLAKEEQFDVKTIKGSYAGAMGIPQFIASSYRAYAIDYEKQGQVDLINSIPNALGSTANFLKRHGWKTKAPIIDRALIQGKQYQNLLGKNTQNPKLTLSLSTLKQHGVQPEKALKGLSPNEKVSLLELSKKEGKEHWLGYKNFYVLTRYNQSSLYALAVVQLSEKMRALKDAG